MFFLLYLATIIIIHLFHQFSFINLLFLLLLRLHLCIHFAKKIAYWLCLFFRPFTIILWYIYVFLFYIIQVINSYMLVFIYIWFYYFISFLGLNDYISSKFSKGCLLIISFKALIFSPKVSINKMVIKLLLFWQIIIGWMYSFCISIFLYSLHDNLLLIYFFMYVFFLIWDVLWINWYFIFIFIFDKII